MPKTDHLKKYQPILVFNSSDYFQNPFLPGESDLNQLQRIFETLGTPTEEDWPGLTSLPDYVAFKPCPGIPLSDIFIAADDHTINMLNEMLRFDPAKRVNCTQVCRWKMHIRNNILINMLF